MTSAQRRQLLLQTATRVQLPARARRAEYPCPPADVAAGLPQRPASNLKPYSSKGELSGKLGRSQTRKAGKAWGVFQRAPPSVGSLPRAPKRRLGALPRASKRRLGALPRSPSIAWRRCLGAPITLASASKGACQRLPPASWETPTRHAARTGKSRREALPGAGHACAATWTRSGFSSETLLLQRQLSGNEARLRARE